MPDEACVPAMHDLGAYLVSNTKLGDVPWLRMAHFGSHRSPGGVWLTHDEFNCIQGVLDKDAYFCSRHAVLVCDAVVLDLQHHLALVHKHNCAMEMLLFNGLGRQILHTTGTP